MFRNSALIATFIVLVFQADAFAGTSGPAQTNGSCAVRVRDALEMLVERGTGEVSRTEDAFESEVSPIKLATKKLSEYFSPGKIESGQMRKLRLDFVAVATAERNAYNELEASGVRLARDQVEQRAALTNLLRHVQEDSGYFQQKIGNAATLKDLMNKQIDVGQTIDYLLGIRKIVVGDHLRNMTPLEYTWAWTKRKALTSFWWWQDRAKKKFTGAAIVGLLSYRYYLVTDPNRDAVEDWQASREEAMRIQEKVRVLSEDWRKSPPKNWQVMYSELESGGAQLRGLFRDHPIDELIPASRVQRQKLKQYYDDSYRGSKDRIREALAALEAAEMNSPDKVEKLKKRYESAEREFATELARHAVYSAFFPDSKHTEDARDIKSASEFIRDDKYLKEALLREVNDAARELKSYEEDLDQLSGREEKRSLRFFGSQKKVPAVVQGIRSFFNVNGVINEVSGAALDQRNNVIWTFGDHGNDPALGRTSLTTYKTDKIWIEGVKNHDWEAITMDPSTGHLWILDMGDKGSKHDQGWMYEVDPSQVTSKNTLKVLKTVNVFYDDVNPHANIEAATFKNGQIYIFEKVKEGSPRIFRIPVNAKAPTVQRVKPIARLPAGTEPFTDASISPSGQIYLLNKDQILRCDHCTGNGKASLTTVKKFPKEHIEALIAVDDDRFIVGDESGNFSLR